MEYLQSHNNENEAEKSFGWTPAVQSNNLTQNGLTPTMSAAAGSRVSNVSEAVAIDSALSPKAAISGENVTNMGGGKPINSIILPSLNSAPEVSVPLSLLTPSPKYHLPTDTVIYTNPTVDCLTAPIQGPLTPLQEHQGGFSRQLQNHATGNVEPLYISNVSFYDQFHFYEARGITENPYDAFETNSTSLTLQNNDFSTIDSVSFKEVSPLKLDTTHISTDDALDNRPVLTEGIGEGPSFSKVAVFMDESILNSTNPECIPVRVTSRREERRKRKLLPEIRDPSSEEFMGPWAKRESLRNLVTNVKNTDKYEKGETKADSAEALAADSIIENSKSSGKSSLSYVKKSEEKVTTIFHAKAERDYQGRSWVDFPVHFKEPPMDQQNYLPKTSIYTYVGHTMGVHAIRFFPFSGHLLLSAGLDSQIKIWDCYNQRPCLRTYLGHELGVRDIQFAHDGRKFYSCSYDKNIQLWDTEYGKILGTFSNGSIPYCVSPHPEPDQEHIFIIGSANKRAVQFDSKSGQIVQEYNEHLAAVNSVTFCENGRKLVTTSDDKKVFIWDYGIPVVVKHIAEPSMHSMPSVCVHPSKKFLAAQSMDNKIVVYEAFGRFRFQGRKQFRGHACSGYAIHPGFSPDGRYIMSGDAGGKLWFWDWKNMKNYRTLQCHHGVCIDCAWHPTMTSRVATCGWDGLIKLWD